MSEKDRDFREEPIEWRELKEFVVDQVKRAGRRIDSGYVKEIIRERGGNVDRVLDKLAEKGFLAPSAPTPPGRPSAPVRRTVEGRRVSAAVEGRGSSYFREYKNRIIRKVEGGFTGLRVHAAAYAGFNLMLFVIWLTTGGGHPWFLYPMGAWGIGLLNHLNPVVQRLRQRREVKALPDLSKEDTRYLKRLHRRRTGFAAHFISAASLSAFLMMVNVITGGGFPWALIPTAALSFGVFMHWSAYAPKGRRMKREIRGWIRDGGGTEIMGPSLHDGEPEIVHQAAELRLAVLRQIEEMERDHPDIGKDVRPLLDTYFQQVSQLAKKSLDIGKLLAELPIVDLEEDRAKLKNRMDSVESDRLRQEYEKSILEVDRQLASLKELSHHGEMLDLRLSSAVNLMKQLQLDLARVKGASLTSASSFGLLKDKSTELSDYLEDLEAGYNELESDL